MFTLFWLMTYSNNKALLCYNLCRSLLASQFLSSFFLIPDFISQYLSSVLHFSGNLCGWIPVGYLGFVSKNGAVRDMQSRGWMMGSWKGQRNLCRCLCDIILPRNLLCQAEAQSQVPVRFLVPQGTGYTRSKDYAVVLPCDRDCNLAVDPTTYFWKGLLEFCCNY